MEAKEGTAGSNGATGATGAFAPTYMLNATSGSATTISSPHVVFGKVDLSAGKLTTITFSGSYTCTANQMGIDLNGVKVVIASDTAIELEPANTGDVAYICVGE